MNIDYHILLSPESKSYRIIRLESLKKFPESFGANYQEALKIEKFRMETDIEIQTQERFVIGAFANGKLIGICAFVKEEDNTGGIYQMYVKEDFQGKNIGFGLIQAVIEEAHKRFNGINVFLEVTHKNEKAYNLYRKIGFTEVNSDEGRQKSNKCTQLQLNTTGYINKDRVH